MSEEKPTLPTDGPETPNPEIKEPEKTVEPPKNDADTFEGEAPKGFVTGKRFAESQTEALRLKKLAEERQAEIERLNNLAAGANYGKDMEVLYPGFENLGEEEQKNLTNYTNSIRKSVEDKIYQDPAIAFAKQNYNEKVWDGAFNEVAAEFPELRDDKEFKSKYFRADNVPSNIKDILKDIAKIHLFDKAKDIGAKEAIDQQNRIEIERANGGDKTPAATRTLEDWQRLAQTNPALFAKQSKQFNEDMASGKLK